MTPLLFPNKMFYPIAALFFALACLSVADDDATSIARGPVEETNGTFTTRHPNRKLLPEHSCGHSIENKILIPISAQTEHPWIALLRLRFANGRTVFFCTGALISERYVLTAAHCINNVVIPSFVIMLGFSDKVRLGGYNKDTDCTHCQDIEIEEEIVHNKFNENDRAQHYDIALLRLKQPATFSDQVGPICLPLDDIQKNNYDGQRLWAAGWAKSINGKNSRSSEKVKVELPVIPFEQCSAQYQANNIILTKSQMCAGGEDGVNFCHADGGGPLMSRDGDENKWHIQGISSMGPTRCGKDGAPEIYTKVADFIDWILDNIHE